MTLKLTDDGEGGWPKQNPFAQAVKTVCLDWLREHRPELVSDALKWSAFRSYVPMPIEGWGVGSSACFTTALMLSQMAAFEVPLSARELFSLARTAHRIGQGNRGSGIDIAACTYGEVVRVVNSGGDDTPPLERLCWPEHTGFLLIRSGQKADTRAAITSYFEKTLATRRRASSALVRSVGKVCRTLLNNDQELIASLQENNEEERAWSKDVGIPLHTPLQAEIEQAFSAFLRRGWVAIKSLGAGGGDSIGCFYRRDEVTIADLMDQLQPFALQVRTATIERQGATLLCPPSPFVHAPGLGSPCDKIEPT